MNYNHTNDNKAILTIFIISYVWFSMLYFMGKLVELQR